MAFLGLATGGSFVPIIPEMLSSVVAEGEKASPVLNDKASALYAGGIGAGFVGAPIVGGALQDMDNWEFMTDSFALWALILACAYGFVILLGLYFVPGYRKFHFDCRCKKTNTEK